MYYYDVDFDIDDVKYHDDLYDQAQQDKYSEEEIDAMAETDRVNQMHCETSLDTLGMSWRDFM